MCGKLATYLRMCGHDTAYALDRGVEDDDALLAIAEAEGRTPVTRDREVAGPTTPSSSSRGAWSTSCANSASTALSANSRTANGVAGATGVSAGFRRAGRPRLRARARRGGGVVLSGLRAGVLARESL